jgi:N-acetylneuraminic acid mutarotase
MLSNLNAPTPRDRHVAAVFENSIYIFGGFDGTMRVNDLHAYNLEANEWHSVDVLGGTPPSPRHSHAAVVYQNSMFVFGGYDGSYRSDLHEFNFLSRRWCAVRSPLC